MARCAPDFLVNISTCNSFVQDLLKARQAQAIIVQPIHCATIEYFLSDISLLCNKHAVTAHKCVHRVYCLMPLRLWVRSIAQSAIVAHAEN